MTLHKIFNILRQPLNLDTALNGNADFRTNGKTLTQVPCLELDPHAIQKAIALHLEWCVLFNEHLGSDPDATQAPAPLPNATNSGLGRWIAQLHEAGQGDHPLLVDLAQENRRLHRLSRQALDFARSQRMDLASSLLNLEFERCRSRVLDILRSLQKNTNTT
jgi:transposase-like protein